MFIVAAVLLCKENQTKNPDNLNLEQYCVNPNTDNR